MLVDYHTNNPSQYWHLMSYCDSRNPDKPFDKSVVCGELIFWMAEVSCAVEPKELEKLTKQIIESAEAVKKGRPVYDRKKWNREIQNVCFDSYRTGQAIPHIYFKDYGKEAIYCPSYEEQVRMAIGLEKIDAKIEEVRRRKEKERGNDVKVDIDSL